CACAPSVGNVNATAVAASKIALRIIIQTPFVSVPLPDGTVAEIRHALSNGVVATDDMPPKRRCLDCVR
ncbi:hypothetical protein Q6316_30260, partial [Klebsiella pneumoniae]|uniref:hypothetical protein n=1 Tax=Klebsiella pneumoniae TaxID=573 RepID=UPI0027309224